MPNILDANGLRLNTYDEWLTLLSEGFRRIYGDDIDLSSASSDGQMVNFLVQILVDQGDLMRDVFASYDPDQAFGVVLDQRIGLNGIRRQAGQYSKTNVRIEITQTINLLGLDKATLENPAFTVQDIQGTRWILINSQDNVTSGFYDLSFRAFEKGRVQTLPNTITVPVTIVQGVKSVNNPLAQTEIGVDEELDSLVKVRRQKSVALSSDGYQASLESALKNFPGIADAFVIENDTPAPKDGVPPNSIWVIIDGTAPDSDIADIIYRKRNAGCGTFGDRQFQIPRKNQPAFSVRWDVIQAQVAYLKFSVLPVDTSKILDLSAVRIDVLINEIRGPILDINSLATLVRSLEPNALVVDSGFGDGTQQSIRFEKTPTAGNLELSYIGASVNLTVAEITGSGLAAKMKTLPGFEKAEVSATGNPLVISLKFPTPPFEMLRIKSSSLDTQLKITLDNTVAVIRQSSKKFRLTLLPTSIIINSFLLKANDTSVPPKGIVNFTTSGGYGSSSYFIVVNNTQATIDSVSGIYVAGNTPGQDTIEAKDRLGNLSNQIFVSVR